MRRFIIMLLAVIVPIKAWAGIAQPVALKMNHGGPHASLPHAATASVLPEIQAAADSDCCDVADLGSAAHQNECSHLSMPLLAAPALLVSFYRASASAPSTSTSLPRSVVLDVLLEPPLLLH
jgi:hypothetical protein